MSEERSGFPPSLNVVILGFFSSGDVSWEERDRWAVRHQNPEEGHHHSGTAAVLVRNFLLNESKKP